MATWRQLRTAARRLAEGLKRQDRRIVFAESCTGGLVSAGLAGVPGISAYHCGSMVVYRIASKNRWLGISRDVLNDPGPVSREVAALMAERVLERTPEADLAASVTGHLGPDAPAEEDGLVFVGVAMREGRTEGDEHRVFCEQWLLEGAGSRTGKGSGVRLRNRRQIEAACHVLNLVGTHLGG